MTWVGKYMICRADAYTSMQVISSTRKGAAPSAASRPVVRDATRRDTTRLLLALDRHRTQSLAGRRKVARYRLAMSLIWCTLYKPYSGEIVALQLVCTR